MDPERTSQGPLVQPAEGAPGITIGRDAVGNVIVSGDRNNVQVTLVVADRRLLANFGQVTAVSRTTDAPYRGLDAFYETDSRWFFGREKLVQRAWVLFQSQQRGSSPRILAVVGASGSGKSSLVRAGLVPELVRQPMGGMESPKVLVMRPGSTPLKHLSEVLALMPSAGQDLENRLAQRGENGIFDGLHDIAVTMTAGKRSATLLVIDQFEELYTDCDNAEERTAFLENLAFAAANSDRLVSVVLTLRSDFAIGVTAPASLSEAVRKNRLLVQAMDRHELREAIERPASELGHPWPPSLVQNLIGQAEGRAGALPLLQFALRRLWQDHIAGRLTETEWSSRLIEDFLVQAADALFDRAGEPGTEESRDQKIIRRALVAMVQLGEGTADTRRVTRVSELITRGEQVGHVQEVLEPFTAPAARLISVSEQDGEATYELTHEALIASWGRLRSWLGNVAQKREGERIRGDLRFHRKFSSSACEWQANQRRSDLLWGGFNLERLSEVLSRNDFGLSAVEFEFSTASNFAATIARRAKRLRGIFVSAATVTMTALAIFAGLQWKQAIKARNVALLDQSKFLADFAQQEIDQGNPGTGLLLAMEALPDESSSEDAVKGRPYWPPAEVSLEKANRAMREVAVLKGGEGGFTRVALTVDGTRIVTASDDGTARIWDAQSGRELFLLKGHEDAVTSIALTRDGMRAVTGSFDGTVGVWDTQTGRSLAIFVGQFHGLQSIAITPNGNRIIVGLADNTARVIDAETGKQLALMSGHLESPFYETGVTSVSVTPDSAHVVTVSTADGTARVWEIATGNAVFTLSKENDAARDILPVSKDIWVLTVASDGVASIRESGSGNSIVTLANRGMRISCAAISADGKRVVTGLADGTVRIWDAQTGQPLALLKGHEQGILSVAVSADGAKIVTASEDGTARIWDAGNSHPLILKGHESDNLTPQQGVRSIAITSDGTRIITAAHDRTARVWDAKTGQQLLAIRGHNDDGVRGVAVTRDGSRIVTASGDNTARVWDAKSATQLASLEGHTNAVTSVVILPDEKRIITGSWDGSVRLWDLQTGKQLATVAELGVGIENVVLMPDGARIVVGLWNDDARILDVATGRQLTKLKGHTVAVSPDGKRIITGSYQARYHVDEDGFVTDIVESGNYKADAHIWNASTGQELMTLKGHANDINGVAVTSDGERIITASSDRTARIWDGRTGEELAVFKGFAGPVVSAATVDERIVFGLADGTAEVWKLFPSGQHLVDVAKERIGRCLTQSERQRFFLPPTPPSWCYSLSKWPYDLQSLVQAGKRFLHERRDGAAESQFAKALEQDPSVTGRIEVIWADEYIERGKMLLIRQRVEEANGQFALSLKHDPFAEKRIVEAKSMAYIAIGDNYQRAGRYREALEPLSKALDLKPEFEPGISRKMAASYRSKAWEDLAAGLPAQGLVDAEKAAQLAPNDAEVLNTRGQIYLALGRTPAACADFDKSIELGIFGVSPYYGRGVCHEQNGNRELAIADYRKALTIHSSNMSDFLRSIQAQAKERLSRLTD